MNETIENIIIVLGKKWGIKVFDVVSDKGQTRFNEIRRLVGDGISPNILTKTLRDLEKLKLVRRTRVEEKVMYELTEKGFNVHVNISENLTKNMYR